MEFHEQEQSISIKAAAKSDTNFVKSIVKTSHTGINSLLKTELFFWTFESILQRMRPLGQTICLTKTLAASTKHC